MIKQSDIQGYKFAVVGLGLTGISCARFLRSLNVTVGLFDMRNDSALLQQIPEEISEIEVKLGLDKVEDLLTYDAMIVSPGISLEEPLIKTALQQGLVLISDIDLLCLYCPADIVAITGTNGKSSVTTLVADILQACGHQVLLGGNIGVPVLDALMAVDDINAIDVCVLELSSFQLERCQALGASSATILNISEDHMDRYTDMTAYIETKKNIFSSARHIAINLDEPTVLENDVLALNANAAISSYSLTKKEADFYYQAPYIYAADKAIFDCSTLKVKGEHNILNVLAALALLKNYLEDFSVCLPVLEQFSGLKHRCEFVAEINGVTYINDSKGTNEGATVAAIQGLKSGLSGYMHLILGGEDKGADFSLLSKQLSDLRLQAYVFGRCKQKLKGLLGLSDSFVFDSLSDVLNAIYQNAEDGDLVLFSPACASFDMFKNFEHRGEVFSRLVMNLEANYAL